MADFGDTPPLTIRELSGDKREVVLTGRALPYPTLAVPTKQRIEVTWLPGASVGTATVLGPVENPTTINGVWKEKYLQSAAAAERGVFPAVVLNGGAIGGVRDTVELFESICRYGQLLEFTWLDVVRHGFLELFEPRWLTAKDLEWSMTFKWISRGEDVGPVVFVTTAGLGDVAALAQNLLDELLAISVPEGFGIDFGFLDSLQAFQQSLEDAIQSVTDAVTQFTNKVTSVTRTVRGIAATFAGIAEQAEALAGFVENQFGQEAEAYARMFGPEAEETGGIVTGEPFEVQSETTKIQTRLFQLDVKDWVRKVQFFAVEKRAQLQLSLGGEILASVQMKEGWDLRDVSLLYYGTAFEWRRIMLFNELTGVDVDVGELVYVPKMNPEEAGQDAPGL